MSERQLENLNSSANLNDQILLKENLQYLVNENKELKQKLAKYEPTYEINFDYDNRQIELSMKQLGKIKIVILSKSDIDYSLVDSHSITLQTVNELSEIYQKFLYDNFKIEIDKIFTNISQLKEKNL